jgi:hypothetical protein
LVFVTLSVTLCAWRFFRNSEKNEISRIVLIFLAFQFALHMIYGDSPFLYSFHFLPMIILFAVLQAPRGTSTAAAMIAFSWALQQVREEQMDRFLRLLG